ncbi:hypothetical protein [uncultured Bradyrhizobium sp.]|uniref:hypothetical protein n=1 Tax=uncultured Bradyrhizobium sp. TaxID=199684 RepID=UPI00261CF311|nr:hypothetical protein [uncultured Bradyrhizobium sp.]
MSTIWKSAVLTVLVATSSIPIARCEEAISRAADGRYLVDLNGVTLALPGESPEDTQIGFWVPKPPGTGVGLFYLRDLVRDPGRYVPMLRSSDWIDVSAGTSVNHPHEIIGIPVAAGVNKVGIRSGGDNYCEPMQADWARYRQVALDMPTDQYGWTRQDNERNPSSLFIKFLDRGDRAKSRYYPLSCGFAGACSIFACHDNLSLWVSFFSSNKPKGEDYAVKDFDRQIASGIKVLENMVLNRSVDLSHH